MECMTKVSERTGTGAGARLGVAPRLRLLGRLIWLLAGLAVIAASLLVIVVPKLNPFGESTTDRTGPSVLKSLTDLSEYHAASAHYETVVDLAKDTDFVPDWVSGERVIYVGKGDVDAIIDFATLQAGRVTVSEDTQTVNVTLPAPRIDTPTLDLQNSYVADHDQGIVNRFKGSQLEADAQKRALEQMTAAATAENTLANRAKENTTAMLRGLFGAIGFTTVNVTYDSTTN